MVKINLKRIKTVDMSPQAIDYRLKSLAQLYRLGLSIEKARPLPTSTNASSQ